MVGFDFAFAFVTEEDESFLVRFELETELEFVVLVIFSIFEFFEFFEFFEILFSEWEEIRLSSILLPVLLVDVAAAGGRRGDSLSKADLLPDPDSPWVDLGAGVMGAVRALRRSLRSFGGGALPDGLGPAPGSSGSGSEEVSTAGVGGGAAVVLAAPDDFDGGCFPPALALAGGALSSSSLASTSSLDMMRLSLRAV